MTKLCQLSDGGNAGKRMDENTGSEGAREEGGEQGTDWHRLASRVGLEEGLRILQLTFGCSQYLSLMFLSIHFKIEQHPSRTKKSNFDPTC